MKGILLIAPRKYISVFSHKLFIIFCDFSL